MKKVQNITINKILTKCPSSMADTEICCKNPLYLMYSSTYI